MTEIAAKGNRLYFAYGSNMNPEQIHSCCRTPEIIAIASLKDYEMGFFGYSHVWEGGVESVFPVPGQEVWGVIYRLNVEDGESLDLFQDVRLNGTGLYFHYPVTVTDLSGFRYEEVLLYKKNYLGVATLPSRAYMEHILEGAAFHGLPDFYIDKLRKIPVNTISHSIPWQERSHAGFLREASCGECEDTSSSAE